MPTSNRQWFKITPQAKADNAPKKTVLHVYDTIGADPFFGGVDAAELVAEIEGLDADAELETRINSPGGSAWDGLTIANAILRHPGPTSTYVDGLAASAASVVALASDEVTISKYGQMMLHNSVGGVYGTAEQLREGADVLDTLNASMSEFYADRAPSGGDAKFWARAMKAETWYNADEAKAAGLATAIDDSAKREEVEAAAMASITKAAALFKYAGRQAAPGPAARAEIEEGHVPISEKLAERLGLSTDASDEDVATAIDKLEGKGGDKPADKPEDKPADTPEGEPAGDAGEVAAVKAAAAKLGLTVTDPELVAGLQAKADLGAVAHAELVTNRINSTLDTAIAEGKITPALRAKYEGLMRKDEAGVIALLADIPRGHAAPVDEQGHALDPSLEADDITKSPVYTGWEIS